MRPRRLLAFDLSVYSAFLVRHSLKKSVFSARRLCVSEKEESAVLKSIVKQGNTPFLCIGLKIDQKVSTYYQIQAGKWRVGEKVLFGKYYILPDLFVYGDRSTVLGISEELPHIIRWKI